jgi:hypothetical protein
MQGITQRERSMKVSRLNRQTKAPGELGRALIVGAGSSAVYHYAAPSLNESMGWDLPTSLTAALVVGAICALTIESILWLAGDDAGELAIEVAEAAEQVEKRIEELSKEEQEKFFAKMAESRVALLGAGHIQPPDDTVRRVESLEEANRAQAKFVQAQLASFTKKLDETLAAVKAA